ncbi:MAG: nitroreductase family protein [Clostridia bacterium]|nr:nitroreductase family protein [Clostridia bacterium]
MFFIDLAKRRYSTRKYKDQPVELEKLQQVLEAARIAPSAANLQPVKLVVLQDDDMRKKISVTYKRDWILQAPVIIVACGDHDKSWHRGDGKDHCDVDVAIAVDHMTLAAAELGLGTCWICAFDAKKCHQLLELPDNLEPIVLLPLGYPADQVDVNRHQTKRKDMDELVYWDVYKE